MTIVNRIRRGWPLLAILTVALLLRLVAAYVAPGHVAMLTDGHAEFGHELWTTFHMSSPYTMPLYPTVLELVGSGWGQKLTNIALSVISIALLHRMSLQVFGDRTAALLSAAIAALFPTLIYFSFVDLSEMLFTTLVLASFVNWYRERFAWGAVFATLAILTRAIFDLIAPMLVLIFCFATFRYQARPAAKRVLQYMTIYCALMSPWWWHNYMAYGQFVRLHPGMGTVLYIGNNPLNLRGGATPGVDYDDTIFRKIKDPVARDRVMRDAATEFIIHNPAKFADLMVKHFIRLWRPWPEAESFASPLNIAVTLFSVGPILLFGLLSLLLIRHSEWRRAFPIVAYIGIYTLILTILLGLTRYRIPLEPFVIVLAAMAMVRTVRMIRGRPLSS